MSTAKAPKSDILRAGKVYLRDNMAAAKLALEQPEKYPHLQEWAHSVIKKHEEK